MDVADVRAQLDVFAIEDIDDLRVLNGTDRDVEVSVEEEAAFYTALAAVSAQFTDVFKERVRGSNSLAKGKSCDDCGRDFIISYV